MSKSTKSKSTKSKSTKSKSVINAAASNNEAEEILQESRHLIDMPEEERVSRLKELEFQISMLERAHLTPEDRAELPDLSEEDQRRLSWMLNWENFDRMIEKNAAAQALQFQIENTAMANIALERLYRSCGDNETANEYLAKATATIKSIVESASKDVCDWENVNPFPNGVLTDIFKEEWERLRSV